MQYFIFTLIIIIFLFLLALWIQKTTKIFLWNYVAGFSAIISYLFVDYIIFLIDTWKTLHIDNPDAVQWFLVNYKTMVIIVIYFVFFLLFYKSRLFDIEIRGFFKKLFSFFIFPALTVVNLIFTMFLLINWPKVLTYNGYQQIIASLDLTNPFLIEFFKLIPLIIILVPIVVLLLFLEIHVSFPWFRFRTKKKEVIVEEHHHEWENQEVVIEEHHHS